MDDAEPLCEICGEPFFGQNRWYCSDCNMFFCPICKEPCQMYEPVSYCKHYTVGYLGGLESFTDEDQIPEESLRTALEQPLSL